MSISKDYNKWANIYDENNNKTRDLDALATKRMLSNYSFKKVLELGCGTGKNTLWLLEHADEIIGLDFSEEMLKKATEKIKNKSVSFLLTDLNDPWPISSNYFDLVTCSLTLEHIASIAEFFKKAYNALQKGGQFFISELHPIKQYLGSKAQFESNVGRIDLEVYPHHLSDYLDTAKHIGFTLVALQEFFDNENREVPRLITFLFKK